MILAGDIGGTNTRLAYFESDGDRPKQVALGVFPSSRSGSLAEIVEQFTKRHRKAIDAACFGIAGPIKDGASKTPNLPWIVDSHKLADQLRLEHVQLINDLEANAHGISVLRADDLVTLNAGRRDPNGNAALISAGTGLGEAGLHWEGNCYQPFASEGGHVDFAPRNQLEIELLAFMLKASDHVSYERVLSGSGLLNIYNFLVQSGREEEPAWLPDELAQGNPAAVISKVALERRADVCVKALDMFVSIYGAEAGNLALKMLATGGVFLGGGIAPKIIEKLRETSFLDAFSAKGRMDSLLRDIPVKVIVNDKTALLGAARVALFGIRMCE